MDATRCAGILWATVARFEPAKTHPRALDDAVRELARIIYALDGQGFPEAQTPSESERKSEDWKRCGSAAVEVIDAQTGTPQAPAGTYAVICKPDESDGNKPDKSLTLKWPFAQPATRVQGPFADKLSQTSASLFVYAKIDEAQAITLDGAASPGLYPTALLRPAHSLLQAGTRGRRFAGYVTFLLALGLLFASAVWVGLEANVVRDAYVRYAATKPVGSDAAKTLCLAKTTPAEGFNGIAWPDGCDQSWAKEWNVGPLEKDHPWLRWVWLNVAPKELSLTAPLFIAFAGIALLALSAGLGVTGFWFGAFIDNRNRISLSAFQQTAWTLVILSAYGVLSLFNAGVVAVDMRDALQAGQTVSDMRIFPAMDMELWLALGLVVVGTPMLSSLILSRKESPDRPALELRTAPAAVPPDPLEFRNSPAEVSLADLFTGESEANKGTVDISRLQHLVITLTLLSGYFAAILEYARVIGGKQIALAVVTQVPVFAQMPPVDASFLGLLGISHAAYLGFKATKK